MVYASYPNEFRFLSKESYYTTTEYLSKFVFNEVVFGIFSHPNIQWDFPPGDDNNLFWTTLGNVLKTDRAFHTLPRWECVSVGFNSLTSVGHVFLNGKNISDTTPWNMIICWSCNIRKASGFELTPWHSNWCPVWSLRRRVYHKT